MSMPTLLQISASIRSGAGISSTLAEQFVQGWKTAHPDGTIITRDLATTAVPHLDATRFDALISPAAQRSREQQAVVDFSDALIAEIRSADTIVIGLPMYNFGIPSQLKAYFDHIARAGVTFRYTATGPVGLLTDKKIYVFAARGGIYAGSPLDTQTSYVRDFLRFVGISDVEFVYAEGLNLGPQSKEAGLAKAAAEIARLAA